MLSGMTLSPDIPSDLSWHPRSLFHLRYQPSVMPPSTSFQQVRNWRRDQSNLELSSGPSILASRCSNGKEPRTSFKKKKTLVRFKPMPEIDLDTVVEERSEFDAEVTASDLLTTPEEFVIPEEDTPAASFRAYRYMGPVQGMGTVSKATPAKAPHMNQLLDNVTEEMESNEDLEVEMSDRKSEKSEIDTGNEHNRVIGTKSESRADGSSGGSSDSDSTSACFSLSPKPVTKSPTAMHLALKKLDGVMNRRHSSPVKVNYGSQKNQRATGKINHSYDNVGEKLTPKTIAIDYIDRELMPDLSPRSHSVRNPARKSQSFSSKRRGESFKHKKQTLARSITHALSSSQENVKKPDLIEMGECSLQRTTKPLSGGLTLDTRPVYNSISNCEIKVSNEAGDIRVSSLDDGIERNLSRNRELRIELDPKMDCGAVSLTNGSESGSDISVVKEKPHIATEPPPINPHVWNSSAKQLSDGSDTESPPRRGGSGGVNLRPSRRGWSEMYSIDGSMCPGLPPLRSPERLIGSLGDRGSRTNISEKHYANKNDYALKYRQDDMQFRSQCQSCAINVDSDDERSTLV
ncbi:hypothetical protein SK128_012156 [Halocaridina rubra]|uniref:Uncharacterized protein n=1 Tax=Halocaridina rubra TaxID=373956 RepID=A0AAN8WYI8_HALRR